MAFVAQVYWRTTLQCAAYATPDSDGTELRTKVFCALILLFFIIYKNLDLELGIHTHIALIICDDFLINFVNHLLLFPLVDFKEHFCLFIEACC